MTKQQKTDLQLWLKDQSKPLPKSLENLLIEDCMTSLFERLPVRNYFNSTSGGKDLNIDFNELDDWYCENENKLPNMILFVQTLLSRTSDGQPAMPFLDVKTKFENPKYKNKDILEIHFHDNNYDIEFEYEEGIAYCHNKHYVELTPPTLDHLLYREFTEALRVGKTFDEAYKIINLIYCKNA